MSVLVNGPQGLGDNIYQRGVLNELVRVRGTEPIFVRTPWPELLPPGCFPVQPDTRLRTQRKNVIRQPANTWLTPSNIRREYKTTYSTNDMARGSILDAMARAVNVSKALMDMPRFTPWHTGGVGGKPLAVVRPVTERREWFSPARNPDPHALAYVCGKLLATHHVIVVADTQPEHEWIVGPLPDADELYISGELTFPKLMGLCMQADLLVGGVGWLVPYALATRQKALILLGGNGGFNAPEKICGRLAPSDHRVKFVQPIDYCRCINMTHKCNKTISQFDLDKAIKELTTCQPIGQLAMQL